MVSAAYASLGTIAIIYVVGILFRVINALNIENARIKVELNIIKVDLDRIKIEFDQIKVEYIKNK